MKIVLFDGIQEMHVVRSLKRALEKRGHSVYMTGKLTSGFEFIQKHEDMRRVERELFQIQNYSPDLVVVFRPSALPFHYLQLLRTTSARIFAWFSDDPVLWNFTYRESVNEYDLILHCGNYKVLEFYEKKFGRPTGVNFPFWTDQIEFPYSYTVENKEKEIIFFGNVSDSIRRQRYYDLSSMKNPVRIYGKSDPDYFELSGGYLDFNHEVINMARNSKLSINIPQIFEVRQNDDSWFDGLSELGSFEIPSRIVQSAALGIPMVSIEDSEISPSAFSSAIRVGSIDECDAVIEKLQTENSFAMHSKAAFEEFLRYFTADSRAMALESLMNDDSWTQLDSMARSAWYRKFDALGEREASEFQSADCSETSHRGKLESCYQSTPKSSSNHNQKSSDVTILVGERWQDLYSNSSIMLRNISPSLERTIKFDLFRNGSGYKLNDPSGVFQSLIDVRSFAKNIAPSDLRLIFVGSKFFPSYESRSYKEASFQFHLLEEEVPSRRTDLIVASAQVVSFLNANVCNFYKSHGNTNVYHISDVFEPSPISLDAHLREGVKILVQRRGHLSIFEETVNAAVLLGAEIVVAEDYYNDRNSERFYNDLSSRLTLILPDPSRPGNLGSKFILSALQMSDNVGFVRGSSSLPLQFEHDKLFMFSSVQEMLTKSRAVLEMPNRREGNVFSDYAGVFHDGGYISMMKLIKAGE